MRDGDPGVYALYAPEVRKVKIGHSGDIRARYGEIRTASPVDIVLLSVWKSGTHEDEKSLHRELSSDREMPYEWFRASSSVVDRVTSPPFVVEVRLTVHARLDIEKSLTRCLEAAERCLEGQGMATRGRRSMERRLRSTLAYPLPLWSHLLGDEACTLLAEPGAASAEDVAIVLRDAIAAFRTFWFEREGFMERIGR